MSKNNSLLGKWILDKDGTTTVVDVVRIQDNGMAVTNMNKFIPVEHLGTVYQRSSIYAPNPYASADLNLPKDLLNIDDTVVEDTSIEENTSIENTSIVVDAAVDTSIKINNSNSYSESMYSYSGYSKRKAVDVAEYDDEKTMLQTSIDVNISKNPDAVRQSVSIPVKIYINFDIDKIASAAAALDISKEKTAEVIVDNIEIEVADVKKNIFEFILASL